MSRKGRCVKIFPSCDCCRQDVDNGASTSTGCSASMSGLGLGVDSVVSYFAYSFLLCVLSDFSNNVELPP